MPPKTCQFLQENLRSKWIVRTQSQPLRNRRLKNRRPRCVQWVGEGVHHPWDQDTLCVSWTCRNLTLPWSSMVLFTNLTWDNQPVTLCVVRNQKQRKLLWPQWLRRLRSGIRDWGVGILNFCWNGWNMVETAHVEPHQCPFNHKNHKKN